MHCQTSTSPVFDRVKRFLPKQRLYDVCLTFLSREANHSESTLLPYIAESVSMFHKAKPRKAAYLEMPLDKQAAYLAEVIPYIGVDGICDVLIAYLASKRRTLQIDILDIIGAKLKDCQPPAVITKSSDIFDIPILDATAFASAMKSLTEKYPEDDVVFAFIVLAWDPAGDAKYLIPYLDDYIAQMPPPNTTVPDLTPALRESAPISYFTVHLNALEQDLAWLKRDFELVISGIDSTLFIPDVEFGLRIALISEQLDRVKLEMLDRYRVASDFSHTALRLARSITDIKNILNHLNDYDQDYQNIKDGISRGLEILKKLTQIEYKGDNKDVPCLRLRRDAQKLHSKALKDDDDFEVLSEVAKVADPSHPYGAIVELIESDNLAPDRYDALKNIVLANTDEHLAMAALRGRLYFKDAQVTLPAQPEVRDINAGKRSKPEPVPPAPVNRPANPAVLKKAQIPITAAKKIETVFYNADPVVPATVLALQAVTKQTNDVRQTMKDLTWKLLDMSQFEKACAIAVYLENEDPNDHSVVPSWLIDAINISGKVTLGDDGVSLHYLDLIGQFSTDIFSSKSFVWNQALSMLAISSMFLPVLRVPALKVASTLKNVKAKGVPATTSFCNALLDFASKHIQITEDLVSASHIRQSYILAHKQIVQDIDDWYKSALKTTIKYAPARAVWHEWLLKGRYIGSIVHPAMADDSGRARDVRELVDHLYDVQSTIHEIKATDKKLFPDRTGDDIAGPASVTLHTMTKEAVDLVNKWLVSIENLRSVRDDFECKQFSEFSERLKTIEPALFEELSRISQSSDYITRIAATICSARIAEAYAFVSSGKAPALESAYPSDKPDSIWALLDEIASCDIKADAESAHKTTAITAKAT